MPHPNSLGNLRPRPRQPRAGEASNPLSVRLSPEERRQAIQAAQVNNTTLSNFVRDAIVGAAMDCIDPLD